MILWESRWGTVDFQTVTYRMIVVLVIVVIMRSSSSGSGTVGAGELSLGGNLAHSSGTTKGKHFWWDFRRTIEENNFLHNSNVFSSSCSDVDTSEEGRGAITRYFKNSNIDYSQNSTLAHHTNKKFHFLLVIITSCSNTIYRWSAEVEFPFLLVQ